jgi:uncharacterized protein (AIM24 family)
MSQFDSPIMTVIETQELSGCKLEVMQYKQLRGAGNPTEMFYREKLGQHLKTIRVTLKNGKFFTEPGQLHYMIGALEMATSGGGGLGGMLSRAVKGALTGESMYKTVYTGNGTIFLEPTFKHFLLVNIEKDEVVCDRGAFVAAAGDIDIGMRKPDSIAAGALSGEGYFQPVLKGTGIVILQCPVPPEELMTVQLVDDQLVVDGNLAFARTGNIKMSIEKSQKSLLGTLRGGEGMVTIFKGSGVVWLAPTEQLYQPSLISTIR